MTDNNKKKYKLKYANILHNGIIRKPGDVVELTLAEAARLTDFVDLVPEPKTSKANQTKTANAKPKQTDKQKSESDNNSDNSDNNENSEDGGNDGE